MVTAENCDDNLFLGKVAANVKVSWYRIRRQANSACSGRPVRPAPPQQEGASLLLLMAPPAPGFRVYTGTKGGVSFLQKRWCSLHTWFFPCVFSRLCVSVRFPHSLFEPPSTPGLDIPFLPESPAVLVFSY